MRFYKQPHAFYAGVDLHARSMFTHILDHAGKTVFARKNGKNGVGRQDMMYHLVRPRVDFVKVGCANS